MRGAAPKEMGTKAGHSGKQVPFRVVGLPQVPQPELGECFKWFDGERTRKIKYPRETVDWWAHWEDSPLNDGFTIHDWDFLRDTARVHAMHHLGLSEKAAPELRQRLAKYGTTPEDRAKLRIITVTAETAEERAAEAAARNAKIGIIGEGRRLTALPGGVA